MKIQVFDPPMCGSTGVGGPAVDPELVRFAADRDWLARQGVTVERYNLAQRAAAFASNPVVSDTLEKEGNDCLPLTLVDGAVACRGKYPSRAELGGFARAEIQPFAWVINQAHTAVETADPVLRSRPSSERGHVDEVLEKHARRVAPIPWLSEAPTGSRGLRAALGQARASAG